MALTAVKSYKALCGTHAELYSAVHMPVAVVLLPYRNTLTLDHLQAQGILHFGRKRCDQRCYEWSVKTASRFRVQNNAKLYLSPLDSDAQEEKEQTAQQHSAAKLMSEAAQNIQGGNKSMKPDAPSEQDVLKQMQVRIVEWGEDRARAEGLYAAKPQEVPCLAVQNRGQGVRGCTMEGGKE